MTPQSRVQQSSTGLEDVRSNVSPEARQDMARPDTTRKAPDALVPTTSRTPPSRCRSVPGVDSHLEGQGALVAGAPGEVV